MTSLLLLAGVAWLTNCLHATPDAGPASRKLMDAILPRRARGAITDLMKPYPIAAEPSRRDRELFGRPADGAGVQDAMDVDDIDIANRQQGAFREPQQNGPRFPYDREEEEDDNEGDVWDDSVPCHPFGYFFVRGLEWGEERMVPALPRSVYSRLDERTFKYWFGSSYGAFVEYMYDGSLVRRANPQRTRNRRRQAVLVPEPDAPLPTLFNLSNGNERVPMADWDTRISLDDVDPNAPRPTWNERLSHIYHQLFVDVMNLIPNPRNSPLPSYCLLNSTERSQVTEATFGDSNIGKYLECAHWRTLPVVEREQTFGYLFLKKGQQKNTCQNYQNCPYFRMWDHFCKTNSAAVVVEARSQLKARFFENIFWFPAVRGDRIWYSGKRKQKMESSPGTASSTAAPHLFVMGKPVWNPHPRSVSILVTILLHTSRLTHAISDRGGTDRRCFERGKHGALNVDT